MGSSICSEHEKRCDHLARPVGSSWRVDETDIPIPGRWHYLYRAVDKHGRTVDLLLRRDRGISAAQAFFRKALGSVAPRVPRKITLDGHVPSRRVLWLLRREHPCWRNVEVRTNRYLNSVIDQDHRAIKRRCASMAGFKSLASAAITIDGIELAHRIRKRQFNLPDVSPSVQMVAEEQMGNRSGLKGSKRVRHFACPRSANAPEPCQHAGRKEV
jgi:transposase-like protein